MSIKLLLIIFNAYLVFSSDLVKPKKVSLANDNFLIKASNNNKFKPQKPITTPLSINTYLKKTQKLNTNTQIIIARNEKYIYHPNQEKGLYKITRENEYKYKYKKSPLNGFIHIKGGSLSLANFPAKSSKIKFNDLYNSNSIATAYFEYEWQPFKKHRSLSLNTGLGVSYAQGQGRFIGAENVNINHKAQEEYTFILFPLSVGLVYKFKFTNDQLFLPFAIGAIDYNLAAEFRKNFNAFKYAGILGAHWGGGVLLNLGWLEKASALELDKEFGINNTYISLEGRYVISFYDDKDINGFILLAGLSFEY